MRIQGSYKNGFAPRDAAPLYPNLWKECRLAVAPILGPSGSILRDWSGNQNHGTLTNLELNDDWHAYPIGYVLEFDGVDGVVTCSNNVPYFNSTTAATLSGWFGRWSSTHTCGFGFAATISSRFSIIWYNNDTLYVSCSSGTECFTTYALAGTGTYHIALCYDGSKSTASDRLVVYLNGKPITMTPGVGTYPSSLGTYGTTFCLGKDYESRFTGGYHSSAMVHTRTLQAKEVELLASRCGIEYDMDYRNSRYGDTIINSLRSRNVIQSQAVRRASSY